MHEIKVNITESVSTSALQLVALTCNFYARRIQIYIWLLSVKKCIIEKTFHLACQVK